MIQNAKIVAVGAADRRYHAQAKTRGDIDFVASSSMLREFGVCPKRWKSGYESPDSDAKDYGSLLDCQVLTPDRFGDRYALTPDFYQPEKGEPKPWHNGAAICKAWNERQGDKKVISLPELDEANAAKLILLRDEILGRFIADSQTQVWIQAEWRDQKTGLVVPVQCLTDLAPRAESEFASCLGDLKTTRSALPRAWQRWSSQRGYHIQGALNIDLWNSATGEKRDTWCFVVQENFAPWQTARRMLSKQKLEFGRIKYQSLLARYCECLKDDHWPDYDEHKLALQGWTVDEADKWDEAEAISALDGTEPSQDPDWMKGEI